MADATLVANNQSVSFEQAEALRLVAEVARVDNRYKSIFLPFVSSQFQQNPVLYNEYSRALLNGSIDNLDFKDISKKIVDDVERADLLQETSDQAVRKIAQLYARRQSNPSERESFTSALNDINELTEEMVSLYDGQKDLDKSKNKIEFKKIYDHIRSYRTTAYLQELWISFPQLMAQLERMHEIFMQDLNQFIDKKIKEIKELDQNAASKIDEMRRDEKKSQVQDDGSGSAHLPIISPIKQQTSTQTDLESENTSSVQEQKERILQSTQRERENLIRSAQGLLGPESTIQNVDELIVALSSNYRFLNDPKAVKGYQSELQQLYDQQKERYQWDFSPKKETRVPRQAEAIAAQEVIKKETIKNGKPLTAPQIEQALTEANLLNLSQDFKTTLQTMSSDMTYKSQAEAEVAKNAGARPAPDANSSTSQSSSLMRFDNLEAMLDSDSLSAENRTLLLQLDSAAFALQVTTLANGSPAKSAQMLDYAIQTLARQNPSFKKSLENEVFKQSVIDDLTTRVQLVKGSSLAISGKLLGLNSRQSSDPHIFDKVFVIANNLGGSEAATATLLLTKPELQKLGESGPTHTAPIANTLARSPQPTEQPQANSSGENTFTKHFASAESMLWVEATEARSKGTVIMSEDEFVMMVQGPGKTDQKAERYLRKLHASIAREVKSGRTYEQRKELIVAAQQSQDRLGKATGVDIETTPVADAMFVTYSPDDDWDLDEGGGFEQLLFSEMGGETGIEALDPDLTTDTNGFGKRLRNFRAARKQEKQEESVAKVAQSAKWFANPFVVGGGAVLGTAAIGLITQGVAGGIGAGVTSLGGAIAGGAAGGFLIGGPFGAAIGAGIGGLSAGLASLAWHPYGGASLAQMTGQTVVSPFGVDLGVNPFPQSETAKVLGQLGQEGAKAAGQAASPTAINAATATKGIGSGAINSASKVAGNILTNSPRLLAGLQAGGGGAFGTGAVIQLVATPIIAVTITGYLVNSFLLSAFITPGEIPCFDNTDISVCKIASPSSATSVVDVVYQVIITAKEGHSVTITGIDDAMTVLASSDAAAPPAPKSADSANLKDSTGASVIGKVIPAGTSMSYTYTVPLAGKNEYFNTRIVNNLTVTYSGGSDSSVTAKAAVTFGVVSISACWPAPGVVTQGPWGNGPKDDHGYLNEDAIDIGGNAGASIYAPFDGQLTYKVNMSTFGNYAVLLANGYKYIFGHMIGVPGNGITTTVRKGDVIGNVGSTGHSTGPHVHYELQPPDPGKQSILNTFLPEPVDINGLNQGRAVHTDSPLCGPN